MSDQMDQAEYLHQHPKQQGETFAAYIERERVRLHAEQFEITRQQGALQANLDEINREFAAIEAYESAKTGKNTRQAPAGRKPRAHRTSRRAVLIDLIRRNNGMSRGDLLERLGLKGDKNGESSVSNALTLLAKRNDVRREGGRYYPNLEDNETVSEPMKNAAE